MCAMKKFSLKRKEISIELEHYDPSVGTQTYTLRELDGMGRDHFMQTMMNRARIGNDNKPGSLKDITGMQAQLISMSLFDPAGKNVPVTEVQKWPACVQMELFKECQELSGLTGDVKKEEESAKND